MFKIKPNYISNKPDEIQGGLWTQPLCQRRFQQAGVVEGTGTRRVSPGFAIRLALAQKYYGLFTQNDWRVTDRLTLNLGLRWDVQPGPTERFNRVSTIDLHKTEPLFGTPGAIVFPGNTTDNPYMWKTDYENFGPRLGAAYQINRSLVARGGYGLTYVPSNTGFNDGPGFYGAASFTPKEVGDCEGIGVVVPGMVDQHTSRILNAPTLSWRGVDIRESLAAATGLPIHIENSGKACALSLVWATRGDAAAISDLAFVTISDGVGVGII